MHETSDAIVTSFDDATPRREAVRAMGLAGVALLGIPSPAAAQAKAKSPNRAVAAETRKARRRRRRNRNPIGLTSAESEPFMVGANEGVVMKAFCPQGFIAISGGLQGVDPVTVPCMIRESHDEASGAAWVVNVFCSEAANTPLKVGVICFSRDSFRLQD